MQSSSVLNVHLLGLFNDSSKAAFTLDPACRGEKKTKNMGFYLLFGGMA